MKLHLLTISITSFSDLHGALSSKPLRKELILLVLTNLVFYSSAMWNARFIVLVCKGERPLPKTSLHVPVRLPDDGHEIGRNML